VVCGDRHRLRLSRITIDPGEGEGKTGAVDPREVLRDGARLGTGQ
jgi:hypothetical protein